MIGFYDHKYFNKIFIDMSYTNTNNQENKNINSLEYKQ